MTKKDKTEIKELLNEIQMFADLTADIYTEYHLFNIDILQDRQKLDLMLWAFTRSLQRTAEIIEIIEKSL